ncbi:MAG: hypothetical protein ABFC12_05860 [Methanobacterium sp.]
MNGLFYIEILVIFILIILNGIFALSEIAVITSRRRSRHLQYPGGIHTTPFRKDTGNRRNI